MNFGGFVHLSFIATLDSVRLLTEDIETIRSSCLLSYLLETVELSQFENERYAVRRKQRWREWILPQENRHESVKWKGPERKHILRDWTRRTSNISEETKSTESQAILKVEESQMTKEPPTETPPMSAKERKALKKRLKFWGHVT